MLFEEEAGDEEVVVNEIDDHGGQHLREEDIEECLGMAWVTSGEVGYDGWSAYQDKAV